MRNEDFIVGVYSTIEFTSKWMYAARDNIEEYMRNVKLILEVYSIIELTSKWIYVVCHSIEDNVKNVYILLEVQSTIEFTSKWIFVVRDKHWKLHEKWRIYTRCPFNNRVHIERNVCSTWQQSGQREKCIYTTRSSVNNRVHFEMNICSSWQHWSDMRNEECITGVHSIIEFTSKSIYVVCDYIEDYMRNAEFL
jgi:hypothetical protein